MLRPLVAAASDRIIGRAVESFDMKQAERFLPPDTLDDHLKCECHSLVEECLRKPDFAKALAAGVDLDGAIARTMESRDARLASVWLRPSHAIVRAGSGC